MAIALNDNIITNAPKPSDARYGNFADIATALAEVGAGIRYQGLTVGILTGGTVEEYWFKNGIADGDLVIKTPDLSGYEVLTNKSTSTTLGTSNTLYPSQNAVKSYVDTGLALKENVGNKSTSTSLGTSNTLYPSQNAVKGYVDNAVSNLSNKEDVSNKSTDVTLGGASPSSTLYTAEYAVKTYVDNQIAAAQAGIPTFEIDMFANYKFYESDEDGSTTYVGTIKATNGAWLITRYVDTAGDLTATYANESNNATQTTPTLAWSNRATLNYAAVNTLTGI